MHHPCSKNLHTEGYAAKLRITTIEKLLLTCVKKFTAPGISQISRFLICIMSAGNLCKASCFLFLSKPTTLDFWSSCKFQQYVIFLPKLSQLLYIILVCLFKSIDFIYHHCVISLLYFLFVCQYLLTSLLVFF